MWKIDKTSAIIEFYVCISFCLSLKLVYYGQVKQIGFDNQNTSSTKNIFKYRTKRKSIDLNDSFFQRTSAYLTGIKAKWINCLGSIFFRSSSLLFRYFSIIIKQQGLTCQGIQKWLYYRKRVKCFIFLLAQRMVLLTPVLKYDTF